MNTEKFNSVDQMLHRVRQQIAAAPELFAVQGAVVESWRTVGGRRYGPYFSLRYREGGNQRSLYLGRSKKVADGVKLLLAREQAPRRQKLAVDRLRWSVKASLRRHKQNWQRDIVDAGLQLKGYEIRNWRSLKTIASTTSGGSHAS